MRSPWQADVAQAQARLESLQSLQLLERVTASYFNKD